MKPETLAAIRAECGLDVSINRYRDGVVLFTPDLRVAVSGNTDNPLVVARVVEAFRTAPKRHSGYAGMREAHGASVVTVEAHTT